MPKRRKRGSSVSYRKKYHLFGGSTIQKRINAEIIYTKKESQSLPCVREKEQKESNNNSRINPNEYVCLKRNIEIFFDHSTYTKILYYRFITGFISF